jgi:hypothetical protein
VLPSTGCPHIQPSISKEGVIMRLGFDRTHVRTICRIISSVAAAGCLAGSGCELATSDSTTDEGAPEGGTSEDAAKAAAGAGGSGVAAGGDSSKADTAGDSSGGGARHDASKNDAGNDDSAARGGDDTSGGGGAASKDEAGGDDTSKHGDGGAASKDEAGGDTSQDDSDTSPGGAGDDTSKGDAGDDSSAGGAGADTSKPGDGGGPADPEQPAESALCQLTDGETVPYDYTYGLVQEYAFAVSMDCEVGGQLMPLVMEDPDGLTAVLAFESELVDWYRAQILECADETSSWSAAQFGLLPPNDTGFSRGDVAAAIDLFMAVLDQHDGSDDGMTADQKREVRERLETIGEAAAVDADEVTMPLDAPDVCPPGEDG